MPNPYFQFRQFTVYHDRCSMKVTTDSCLFGAWVAENIKTLEEHRHILDIGSGSGLLSLMVAQQTSSSIEGIELQKSDFLQSIENIAHSPFSNRITVFNADALSFTYNKRYDIIISNPPFYENDLKSNRQGKNIAHHDATLKLEDLIHLIEGLLNPDGSFYLLFPARRKDEAEALLLSTRLQLNDIVLVRPTEQHDAFRIMIRGSFRKKECAYHQLIIKNGTRYSKEFKDLLEPYYLKTAE